MALMRRGVRDYAPTKTTLQFLELAAADEAAGRHAEASARIGRALAHEDAVLSFEAALRLHPRSIALLIGLATAYEKGGYVDDAERNYNKVLAIDPARIGAIAGLAFVQRRRGHHDRAAELFGRCIDLAERSKNPQFRAGLPWYRLNRAQQRIVLGDLAADAKHFDDARLHFQGAVDDLAKIEPSRAAGEGASKFAYDFEFISGNALLGLGRAEHQTHHDDRAAALLRDALDTRPAGERRKLLG